MTSAEVGGWYNGRIHPVHFDSPGSCLGPGLRGEEMVKRLNEIATAFVLGVLVAWLALGLANLIGGLL